MRRAHPSQPTQAAQRWRTALLALRSEQWAHFLALPLAGQGALWMSAPSLALPATAAGVALTAGCLAWAYGLNAITDRHQDRSPRKNPLVAAESGGELATLLALCLAATVAGAAHVGGWTLSATLVSITAGTLYSAGPRLKAIPGLGTLINALIFAPLPLMGAPWAAWSWAPLAAIVAVFIALLCHNQLLHELADAGEDEPASVHTTAARLGAPNTARLGAALSLIAALIACQGQSLAVAIVAAMGLLASSAWLFRAPKGDPSRLRRTHRLLSACCGAALLLAALLGPAA